MSVTIVELTDAIDKMDYGETRSYKASFLGVERKIVVTRKRIFSQLTGTPLKFITEWWAGADGNNTGWAEIEVYNASGELLRSTRFHHDRRSSDSPEDGAVFDFIIGSMYDVDY